MAWATLSPGQSATLSVEFAPNASETFTGSVTVNSTASNSPQTIKVSGTASQASSTHKVVLTWKASPSKGVTGYKVYRLSSGVGTFAELEGLGASSLSYTDANVVAGDSYTYAVTAVDAKGDESAFSSEVKATIP